MNGTKMTCVVQEPVLGTVLQNPLHFMKGRPTSRSSFAADQLSSVISEHSLYFGHSSSLMERGWFQKACG